MQKKTSITRYSADDIKTLQARGESRTNWQKAGSMDPEKLRASISSDADEAGLEFDWTQASPVLPSPKAILHMRVDQEILDYFKAQGKGYQTAINAVLASYVKAHTGR
jgi:uncharacterized protein (DUF4415 family)